MKKIVNILKSNVTLKDVKKWLN